jgi:MFS family permease
MLARVGVRRWIGHIMITWGLVSVGMAWVNSPTSFYVLRFLLGVAEAGFFPGIILYFSYWFCVLTDRRLNRYRFRLRFETHRPFTQPPERAG